MKKTGKRFREDNTTGVSVQVSGPIENLKNSINKPQQKGSRVPSGNKIKINSH